MDDVQVTEEVALGDLTDVKEQKQIVPASSGVLMKIAKAGTMTSKNGDIKSLKLELRIVDGISVIDPATGTEEVKYKNKPMFTSMMDLPYWCDTAVKTSKWWQTKQYLLNFKKLCLALDIDIKSVTVNDAFLEVLIDRELLVDIRHEENQVKNEAGEYVADGTFREKLVNWRKA
jgi:hypothetical protein